MHLVRWLQTFKTEYERCLLLSGNDKSGVSGLFSKVFSGHGKGTALIKKITSITAPDKNPSYTQLRGVALEVVELITSNKGKKGAITAGGMFQIMLTTFDPLDLRSTELEEGSAAVAAPSATTLSTPIERYGLFHAPSPALVQTPSQSDIDKLKEAVSSLKAFVEETSAMMPDRKEKVKRFCDLISTGAERLENYERDRTVHLIEMNMEQFWREGRPTTEGEERDAYDLCMEIYNQAETIAKTISSAEEGSLPPPHSTQ